MNITKHISTLLQFHECVVVPDFGGFISNYIPARYDKNTQTFFPPKKEVVFNSKIKKNDGLLLNYLVEEENLTYQNARKAIEDFVDLTLIRLNHGETVDFPNLGSLHFSHSGSFVFEAKPNLQLIETYGLTEFHHSQQTRKKQPVERPAVRALHPHKNAIRIAAGIALLIALSLFPVKKENSVFQSSYLNPLSVITSEPTLNEEPEQVKEESEPIKEETTKEVAKAPYILVGGSFYYRDNAETLKAQLEQKGHKAEVLVVDEHFFRVSIDAYHDWQQAIDAMKKYRGNHPGSEAWVSTR